MEEIRKDIPDYEGLYQVSNLGNVKSLDRVLKNRWGNYVLKGKMVKYRVSKKGYIVVDLSKESRSSYLQVHRLVAKAFIPNTEGKPQVNHEDGNKANNRVSNLTWVTPSENTIHGYNTGLIRKRFGKDNPRRRQVIQKSKQGEFIKLRDSMADAGRILGFSSSHITSCCKGRKKSIGGYKREYTS